MPVQNKAISEVLEALTPSPTPTTKAAQLAALDALMRADLDPPSNFRKAVIKHQAVLGREEHPEIFTGAGDTVDFLIADGEHPITALQQKAAEKRIMFGFPDDLASLKEILSKEDAQLRPWFKTKQDLFGDYDWETGPHILTDEALVRIKEQAQQRAMQQITAYVDAAILQINTVNAQITAALTPHLQASSIAGAIEKLTSMREATQQLERYMADQCVVLEKGEAAGRALSGRVEAVNTQLDDTTTIIYDKAITFIETQHQEMLAGVDGIDFEAATSAVLKPKLDLLTKNSEAIESAFVLAKMSVAEEAEEDEEEEADEEDGVEELVDADAPAEVEVLAAAREQKNRVAIALTKLKAQYYVKLVTEKAALVADKEVEISQHNGPERERKALLGTATAAFRTIQEQATASASQVTRVALDEDLYAADERERLAALNVRVQEAMQAAEDSLKLSKVLVTLPPEPPHFGNMFIDHEREIFNTVVVKNGGAKPVAAVRLDVGALSAHVAVAATQPKYERVLLAPGDAIYSLVAFNKPAAPAGAPAPPPATVQLVQNHTGKVTLSTTGSALNPEERLLAAIRQAEMLLNNYESGDIIISGDGKHAEQAKVLLAVMLVLQQKCPALAEAKIVSEVRGCVAPEPVSSRLGFLGRGEDQATVNQKFITNHLPPVLASEQKLQRIADQVNQFTQVKTTNRDQFAALKQQITQARQELDPVHLGARTQELAQNIQRLGFQQNEQVDLEGTRSPIPGR